MRCISRVLVLGAALASVAIPVEVDADGYVTPWIGANVTSATDAGDRGFGATAGYMGAGIFGFEADFGYSPDFLGSSLAIRETRAVTIMSNAILGVPIGGTEGAGVRPFVSGGLGLMRSWQDIIGDSSLVRNDLAYELGAGMMGFFNQHVGLRGEVRYVETLQDVDLGEGVDFARGRLQFWRVSAGFTFR